MASSVNWVSVVIEGWKHSIQEEEDRMCLEAMDMAVCDPGDDGICVKCGRLPIYGELCPMADVKDIMES